VKLVILDRDGVINHDSAQFIKSTDEWRPFAGSMEAIARLNQAGFRVVVATNQSGVERGLFDMGTLNAINEKMMNLLAQHGGRIDAVFFCPHAAESHCACRKPRPGMFLEIGQRFNTTLADVPSIGDSPRDLEASAAVGALPILVLTGKGEKTRQAGNLPPNTEVYHDLAAAAKAIIARVL
jgi:D-glycero-D-manno-heptose 1,7-bisphosphate phosphatase